MRGVGHQRLFELEALEARVLLSADPSPLLTPQDPGAGGTQAATVSAVVFEESPASVEEGLVPGAGLTADELLGGAELLDNPGWGTAASEGGEDAAGNPEGIPGAESADMILPAGGRGSVRLMTSPSVIYNPGDELPDDLLVTVNTLLKEGSYEFQTLTVQDGATLTIEGGSTVTVAGLLLVTGNSTILCQGKNQAAQVDGKWAGVGVTLMAGNLEVTAGSVVSADAQGYWGGEAGSYGSYGRGPGGGPATGGGGSGGSYGGYGGAYAGRAEAYGSIDSPIDLGSGGGDNSDNNPGGRGGYGGGAIRLVVSGVLTLEGTLSANGEAGQGNEQGGGSGGSIWVTTDKITGSGQIRAMGGAGQGNGSGGGGGRVAIHYEQDLGYSGFTQVNLAGGAGNGAGTMGTLAVFDSSAALPHLRVFSNYVIPADTTVAYQKLTVEAGGTLTVGGGSTVTVSERFWVKDNSTVLCLGKNTSAKVGDQWAGVGVTLSAKELVVEAGSRVSADSQGYVGGESASIGSYGRGPGGAPAYGGGGSGGSYGGYGGAVAGQAAIYGSASAPTDLGSGGGDNSDNSPGGYGGSGGGAIRLVVSGTFTLDGVISANGGDGVGSEQGGGSGGSIWVTTQVLTGAGLFQATGGAGQGAGSGGGGGRIAIYYTQAAEFTGYTASTAAGGTGNGAGQVGTVAFFDQSVADLQIRVFENWVTPANTQLTYGAVTLDDAATWTIGGGSEVTVTGALSLTGSSTIFCGSINQQRMIEGQWRGTGVTLRAGSVAIAAGSAVNASGQGYLGGEVGSIGRDGRGPGGAPAHAGAGSGGSYGGVGGAPAGASAVYGSIEEPLDLGSGGGDNADNSPGGNGGAGGGVVHLVVSGTLTLDGTISADGGAGVGGEQGGGSGGSVWLEADVIAGSGNVTANGGAGQGSGGGGGGGRVALYYSAGLTLASENVTVSGGSGSQSGGAGTVYRRDTTPSGPYVVSVTPAAQTNAADINRFVLTLSAAVVGEGARDVGTYTLTFLGADRVMGGADDVVLTLTPEYGDGTTEIRLLTEGALTEGLYELRARSGETSGLRDSAGLPLDQNRDGYGDDLVYRVEVDFTAPAVSSVGPGTAVVFDGVDDWVWLPSAAINGLSDLTVEFWFKTATTRVQHIVSVARAATDNELLLGLNSPTSFGLYRATGNVTLTWTIPAMTDGQWHHVSVAMDGTEDVAALYVDGQAMGTRAGPLEAVTADPGGFVLGQDQDWVGGGFVAAESFQGSLAEFRLWSRVLTADEVRAKRDVVLAAGEPGLAAYWRFDEGTGDVLADRTGNGFDGRLGRGTVTAAPTWVEGGYAVPTDRFRVRYSDWSGMNPSSVVNAAAYALRSSGGDGTFSDGNEGSRTPVAVTFDAATQTAILQFAETLPDDYYQVIIKAGGGVRDAAGNAIGAGSDTMSAVMAVEGSAAWVDLDLKAASDSGVLADDNLTNVVRPEFTVTVNKAGTLALDYDGDGTMDETLPVAEAGVYSLTAVVDLPEGLRSVKAEFTPWVGARVQSVLPVLVDVTGPTVVSTSEGAALLALQVQFSDANGLDAASVLDRAHYRVWGSGGDGVFGDATDVDWSGRIQGVTYDPKTQMAVLNLDTPLVDDYYQVTVLSLGGVLDAAANPLLGGADYVGAALPIEDHPATVVLDLQAGSDSGMSDQDNYTNDTTPSFDVTVNKRGVVRVDFNSDGVFDWTQSVAEPGTVVGTAPVALADGNGRAVVEFTPWVGKTVSAVLDYVIDTRGPVGLVAGLSVVAPYYERQIRFSEEVDPASFTPADTRLVGPGDVDLGEVNTVTGSGVEYVVTFDPVTAQGAYALTIGPEVVDRAGNPLNQDGDGTNGEVGEDEWVDSFTQEWPVFPGLYVMRVLSVGDAARPFERVLVAFSQPVDDATFLAEDVQLTVPGGAVVNPVAIRQVRPQWYELDFTGLTGIGEYRLVLGSQIESVEGQAMDQDHDGTAGEAEDDGYDVRMISSALTIAAGETAYDGLHLLFHGSSVAVGGAGVHSFRSVTALGGTTITSQSMGLTVFDLYLGGASRLTLAGGSTLGVVRTMGVFEGALVVCQGLNTGAKVDDQWAGVGVALNVANLTVDASSRVSADGQGYAGSQGAGVGPGGGTWGGNGPIGGGGSYGG
ncbi:MAG TPA: Ig-like domain-containing protein, partial [Verrucomicrobiota bacterium]|nr:Ig-like domain-containing protein [Verrucomicrobiota bacterium]